MRGCHIVPGRHEVPAHRSFADAFSLRALLLLLVLLLSAAACGARVARPVPPPPDPLESTTLGAGDVFRMQIVGERELPEEYQVASDGSVDFPYVHRISVAGMEPQDVARLVRQRLIDGGILQDPSVVVTVKEYVSKRITVLGQVQKPGTYPLTRGLGLLEAISLAGGLTALAKGDQVRLTRRTKQSARTYIIDLDAILNGRAANVPLQAGDSIYIEERVF
ncbi:MAG: polysaccharide export protein [Polyangiaceae bacterium]|nr:polysaccharide export protein [Polyangiaceae bacterium]